MAVLGPSLPAALDLEPVQPFEWVLVEPDPGGFAVPSSLRSTILVDALEDGNNVPAEFLADASPDHWEPLLAAYARARSWGSGMLAAHVAAALHVPRFFRVNTARALLDYGRMPGVSGQTALPSQRKAIHSPFDRWLTPLQQHDLLERYYDVIGAAIDAHLANARLVLSIETCEEHDPHGRRRPPLGLSSRCHVPTTPPGLPGASMLDPLLPAELLESTADRALRARICDAFEQRGFDIVENYPHLLSEGGLVARSVSKQFFWRVREAFTQLHADSTNTRDPDAEARVWQMLFDAERRSGESELLRGYLQRLQSPPGDWSERLAAARSVYQQINAFVTEHREALVDDFRRAPDRFSVLVVQVRKDLVWDRVNGAFGSPRADSARAIARILAEAVRSHLVADLDERVAADFTTAASNGPRRIVGE